VIKLIENNRKIELFLNASDINALKFQPNNLLYWEIIEYGKKNNFAIFDLGGYQSGAKPGNKLYEINRFKERWGGKIVQYDIYSKNLLYIIGRKIIRNFYFIKKIRDKIKTSKKIS
jgi:lipid II:glycine glycyltransferase (peptidoglycan interpeptide bridge formation enzyme)